MGRWAGLMGRTLQSACQRGPCRQHIAVGRRLLGLVKFQGLNGVEGQGPLLQFARKANDQRLGFFISLALSRSMTVRKWSGSHPSERKTGSARKWRRHRL